MIPVSRGKHRKARNNYATKAIGTGTLALAMGTVTTGFASAAPDWDQLAMCESSGDWNINTGNGFYGGLQFSPTTWLEFGGGVYAQSAHNATREQQIEIAQKVLDVQGPNAWPMCSQQKIPGWWTAGAEAPIPAPVVNPPAPAPPPAVGNTSGWMWPVDCPLTSGFGNRGGVLHNGADFGCAIGTPIHAAATGTIESGTGFNTDPGGYGNYIQQRAVGGEMIQYGHVSEIYVGVGDFVTVGQIIGAVGNAGSSSGPHLHLRIDSVDPVWFLNHVGAANTGETFNPTPPAPAPAPEPNPAPVDPIPAPVVENTTGTPIFDGLAATYAVEWGDTLTTVAERFGTSVEAILGLNPWIGNVDLIFADRDILLMLPTA
jgi:murein DD-endopeptidase MepM/ murein hydrolase activator NlpD